MVQIKVPVRLETYRWLHIYYKIVDEAIDVYKQTPVLGSLTLGLLKNLNLNSHKGRNRKVARFTTKKVNGAAPAAVHEINLRLYLFKDVALAGADDLEILGAMIDEVAYMHRVAWVEGYIELKSSLFGAAGEYVDKHLHESDQVPILSQDKVRKETERWLAMKM